MTELQILSLPERAAGRGETYEEIQEIGNARSRLLQTLAHIVFVHVAIVLAIDGRNATSSS